MTLNALPRAFGATLLLAMLAGCDLDIPGLGPDPRVLAREAEAQAVGGACRHALRGLEDCFVLNPKSPKAMVFAGWKSMDEYMRTNKIEGSPSVLSQTERSSPRRTEDADPSPSAGRSRS